MKGPSANLKKCLKTLREVAGIKNKKLQRLRLHQLASDNCFYNGVREVSVNTLKGNIPLSTIQKRKMRRHAKIMKQYKRNRKTITSKRKLLVQSGGFLGAAAGILLPLILDSIIKK